LHNSRRLSGRRLEAETHRNIEVTWLLRHLKPDLKTIADFRRDNRNAFRPIFRQFVLLCTQLDLIGREPLAVDGTRIKSVNNKDRYFARASLTQLIKRDFRRPWPYVLDMFFAGRYRPSCLTRLIFAPPHRS
jgi:hypothetical protein